MVDIFEFDEADVERYADVLFATVAAIGREGIGTHLEFTLSQRLWRHEHLDPAFSFPQFGQASALDLVHKSYLTTYLEDHLMPFADAFGRADEKQSREIESGKGFAKGMGANIWDALEPRLIPRK